MKKKLLGFIRKIRSGRNNPINTHISMFGLTWALRFNNPVYYKLL